MITFNVYMPPSKRVYNVRMPTGVRVYNLRRQMGFTEDKGDEILPIENTTGIDFSLSGGATGTLENSALSRTGQGSARWVTDTGLSGATILNFYDAFLLDMTTPKTIGLWIYAETQGISETNRVAIDFTSSTSTFVTHVTLGDTDHIFTPGWNYIEFDSSEWAESGESWSDSMRSMRLVCAPRASRDQQFHVDSLIVGHKSRPKVIFTMDDTNDSQYTIAWDHATYGARNKGIPLVLATIPELIDDPGRLTTAQINDMHSNGCDVILHDQTRWDQFATPQALTDYINTRRGLYSAWPGALDLAAWPEGRYGLDPDATLTPFECYQGLLDAGVKVSRTTARILQALSNLGLPHAINTTGINLNSGLSLAQAQAYVDLAELRGHTCIFYGHQFGAVADGSTWVDSDLGALYDYTLSRQSADALDITSFSSWARNVGTQHG